MIARVAVAAALLCSALPALAEFEGVADLKMTGKEAGQALDGTGKVYLSPVGWRMEMEMKLPESAQLPNGAKAKPPTRVHRMVSFGKIAEPNKSWIVNDRNKTYHVVEADKDANRDAREEQDWKVTKLGSDTVAGFSCTNIRAERTGRDETYEACLAKDFISDSWLKSAKEGKEWWVAAARKAGYTGYPVRLIGRAKDGSERHRMEIVKVERRKVPASMFAVPAGYKEGSMMDVMMDPDQQRQMQEAQRKAAESMKKMSPEQRKMMEEMMKKYGGGQQQAPKGQ
jgi:hypothetical protein